MESQRDNLTLLEVDGHSTAPVFAYARWSGGSGEAVNYLAEGLRYELVESADLVTWQPVAVTLSSSVVPAETRGMEAVVVQLPAPTTSAANRFYSLRITRD